MPRRDNQHKTQNNILKYKQAHESVIQELQSSPLRPLIMNYGFKIFEIPGALISLSDLLFGEGELIDRIEAYIPKEYQVMRRARSRRGIMKVLNKIGFTLDYTTATILSYDPEKLRKSIDPYEM